jgi:hypothetical protein
MAKKKKISGTPFGQEQAAPKTSGFIPSSGGQGTPGTTFGELQPTVTIGGAPAGYSAPTAPNFITGAGVTTPTTAAAPTLVEPPPPPRSTRKIVSVYTDEKTGDVIDVYDDGTEVIRRKGTVKLDAQKEADATAAKRLAEKTSAFDILQREFTAKGLGFLVEAAKNAIMNEETDSGRILALRSSPAYKLRFSANEQRINKGLRALDEADYLAIEDQYQEVMRQYGLPESYYSKDATGKQVGFEQLIASDVSNVELADRLMVAQDRVLKANPEVMSALKQFYPGINNGDILAYTLDPKNAIKEIQRKVTTAEIGGAAMQSGLSTNLARAEELGRYGVDKQAATQGFTTIGAGLQRGSQLASIYQQDPYTQAVAESEVFNIPGAQEARKQRQKITGLERAAFSGQTGLTQGALTRDRAGGY